MLYHIFKLVCLIFLFGRVLYRMKTNRRSKRVKKTRRNRRSRRMQRGGDPMYEYNIGMCKKRCLHDNIYIIDPMKDPEGVIEQVNYKRCIQNCETTIKPLKHYDEKTAVNGWYIFSRRHSDVYVYYYLAHTIMTKNNPNALNFVDSLKYPITAEFDEKLDELPDLQKTYKTGRWYQRKQSWKLMYNEGERLFEWTNQKDKEMTQPFLIASPLKIGDEIAT